MKRREKVQKQKKRRASRCVCSCVLDERIITVNIPLCLRCISRSRSARKDPRRVPLTFALRPWQSRETLRIDPISSLADRKSRKRSTSRAASRPATRRFVSFQSSLATTSLLVAFVLRAGKGELTLIYKHSLFSLKRALLYFYTSFLRLSLPSTRAAKMSQPTTTRPRKPPRNDDHFPRRRKRKATNRR